MVFKKHFWADWNVSTRIDERVDSLKDLKEEIVMVEK